MTKKRNFYKISVWGTGNVALRLSIALKQAGHFLEYVCGRDEDSGNKIVRILNKEEEGQNPFSQNTNFTNDYTRLTESEVLILAVSDDAIEELSHKFSLLFEASEFKADNNFRTPLVVHTSGASSMNCLSQNRHFGVFYPLMTLSKIKPVDFKIIPFLLEGSDSESEKILADLAFSLGSEYRLCDSSERLRTHLAAVYVSNFINYLAGLAFDLAKPNHVFLMPLAIETVRKAFLYEHPSGVQTGPAKRGDLKTINKHLSVLKDYPEHETVYRMLTNLILEISGHKKIKL